jgi:hypothetical protein
MTHTPGPWEVYEGVNRDAHWHNRACVWSTSAGHLVAYTDFMTTEIAEANARLIAAAPDLLEALRAFAFGDPVLEQIIWRDIPDDHSGTITVKLADFRRARAAIAKATGSDCPTTSAEQQK